MSPGALPLFCFLCAFAPLREDSLLFALFPRRPGFYYNPFKLVAILAVYLAWVRTCWWVDRDCREVGLPTARWNPILLASGAAGLLLVWTVPVFAASFLA